MIILEENFKWHLEAFASENSALHYRNKLHLKYIKIQTAILNFSNVSQYYIFTGFWIK